MRLILLLTAAALGLYLLFFHRLTDRDLWSSHEARAAMNAQTILDTGDWGLPTQFDGAPERQKPPLYYWLVAFLANAQGGKVDALSERLPAVLSALLCLAIILFLGFRCGRFRLGVSTALVLATAMSFSTFARTGRIDMPLTFTVSVVIVAFHLARNCTAARERFGLQLAGYAALAAGILLKGPIAVVLPAVVLLVQAVVDRRVGKLGLVWGLPMVLVLTVPWFVWAHIRTHGEFTRVFFWHHNVQRGLGGSLLRAHPWWFYGPQLAWGFLPWSLLLPLAFWWNWVRKAWRDDAELRLGLIWLLTMLAVLSCARFKRADYLLPAYPGAALFLGCMFVRWWEVKTGLGVRGIGCRAEADPLTPNPSPPSTGERGEELLAPVARPAWFQTAFLPVIAACCCLGRLGYVEWILPREEPFRECKRFAKEIRALAPAPESVTLFRTEPHLLAFHLGRPLTILIDYNQLANRLQQPDCHYVVMPPECLTEYRRALPHLPLEEVLRNTPLAVPGADEPGIRERPLVLLRSNNAVSR
jgi:4-amino-4-deoxy-L-arabinose transferase-like glycosyltransferase